MTLYHYITHTAQGSSGAPFPQHGSRCPHPHFPLAALNRIQGEAQARLPPFAPPGAGHGLAPGVAPEDSPGTAAGTAPGTAQHPAAPSTGKGGAPPRSPDVTSPPAHGGPTGRKARTTFWAGGGGHAGAETSVL